MGRFSYEDADKYGSQGNGGSFFKIENDMEIKRVRLLGRDMNDFPGYACHEVEIDGRRRLVNCLRDYNEPVSVCPFCSCHDPKIRKQIAKVFIPLYNLEDDEVQVWERGKSFFPILSSYCSRHKNVVSYITEVERHGKPKDTNTTYMLYEAEEQGDERVEFDDYADRLPEILGRYILDKSAEDMEYFLESGEFLDEDSYRRRGGSDRGERAERTGGRRRRGSEDVY